MEWPTFLSCEKTSDVATNIKTYLLRVPESITTDELKPGRFIVINHPDLSGTTQKRNYSITALRDNKQIEITVKRTGNKGVSDSLHSNINSGSLIYCSQVGGNITSDRINGYRHVLMLAGGIGITLPIALIRCLALLDKEGKPVPKVTLLVSSPTIDSIPFLAELLALELGSTWFSVRFFITREAVNPHSSHFIGGRLSKTDLLETAPADAVVICGSHGFSAAQQAHVAEFNGNIPCYIEAFSSPDRSVSKPDQPQHTTVRARSNQLDYYFVVNAGTTLLDALEANLVSIRSQCRSGICGSCRIKVVSGSCKRAPDFSLSAAERESGYALACCSYAEGDELTIEV
ncbi:2Fe-2S iron-sulfur cluster-binding protein [Pseudomonas sp. PB3P13]